MADMLRQTEENGNRLRTLESGIGQLKTDQEQRIQALEQRMSEARRRGPATNRRRAGDRHRDVAQAQAQAAEPFRPSAAMAQAPARRLRRHR